MEVTVPSAIAKGTNKRVKKQKKKCVSFAFSEREYLRRQPKVRISERKNKKKPWFYVELYG